MIKQHINKLHKNYLKFNLTRFLQKKIRGLLKTSKLQKLSKTEEKEVLNYFNKYGIKKIDISWHLFYTDKNKSFHENYIPEDLYYNTLEPYLNVMSFGPAYTDKNMLNILLKEVKQPATLFMNINGFNYKKHTQLIDKKDAIDLCLKNEQFVIKPSVDSGGGKKVMLLSSNKYDEIEIALNKYKKNFIVQEPIQAHNDLKTLNESSVNTIRVMSYMHDQHVEILSSVLRIGSKGQFTDNTGSGGISVGINTNGTLKNIGYDYNGMPYTKTSNQFKFSGFKVPFYHQILSKAKQLHPFIPHFKLVSWDFTIDNQNDIVLIEFNTMLQEINFHQLNNGPLFGEFTDEILSMATKT